MERNKRVFRLLALSAAIGGALFATAQAGAVDVRGSVRAGDSKPTTPESVRAPYWHEWNGFIEPKKQAADLTREVAVVLIGAEGMKDAATVAMDNGALSPSTIVVQKGSALRIRNDDDFTHKLYAEGIKQFDAVETSSGQARQLQIDEEGSFAIYDVLAPHVRGVLHVLPKITKIANPQSDGTFKFNDVAPGTYTMKVFRGAFEVSSSTLEIPDKRELVVDPISVDVKNK